MPRIFDNIDRQLLPALKETLVLSQRADYCVGCFNLRGWKQVDSLVEKWPGGDGNCCRLLVGMQQLPKGQLRSALSLLHSEDAIDQSTAIVLKKKLAQEFRDQLTRTNKQQSQARNEFITALATSVLIPHASPGGNAESIARQTIERGQPMFTIQAPENEELIQRGAQPYICSAIERVILTGSC